MAKNKRKHPKKITEREILRRKRKAGAIRRQERTPEQRAYDAVMTAAILEMARSMFRPIFEKIGQKIAANNAPVEWPEEIDMEEKPNES